LKFPDPNTSQTYSAVHGFTEGIAELSAIYVNSLGGPAFEGLEWNN
jgi:hypothetical protein